MTVYRYTGRPEGGSPQTHGPSIIGAATNAHVALVDDPMSFPWELVTRSLECVFVIDIAGCTNEQLVGLRPALGCLTSSDTVYDRTDRAGSSARRFAERVGVRSTEPTEAELAELRSMKQLDLAETRIIERLGADAPTVVVDSADITNAHITAADLEGLSPMPLIAVRVPGEIIRSLRGGLTEFASALQQTLDIEGLRDVWGIRSSPGTPIDRGILVFGPTEEARAKAPAP